MKLDKISGYVEVTRSNGATALVVPKSVVVEIMDDCFWVTVESPLSEYSFRRMVGNYVREECGENDEIIRERWISLVEMLGNPVIVVITTRIGDQIFTCIARTTDE